MVELLFSPVKKGPVDMFFLLCAASVIFTGLSAADVLVAPEGGKVMFAPVMIPAGEPVMPFRAVIWKFELFNIITSLRDLNNTEPQYEGRITLFRSNGSLELRNLTLNDTGTYDITIITDATTLIEELTLEVYVPISNVTVTANNTEVLEFTSVRLSCSSSGSSLSFLWLNGSSEVTASDRVQLTDGGSSALMIHQVTRYDRGPFRCHVTNPVSNGTSDPVNLSVSFGPENVTVTPSKGFFLNGSNINLTCSAVSRPAAHFQWFLNGDKLLDTERVLSLVNVHMNQSGNYSCQAFNNRTMKNETSLPAVISVLKRISAASVNSTRTQVFVGDSVNLTCEAAGSVFTRRWFKDGSPLILSDGMMFHNDRRVLSFQSLTRDDRGEYTCTVANPISSDEAKFTMVVIFGPENIHIIGPREINVKQMLTLICAADSIPPARYTWFLNKTEIKNDAVVFTKAAVELSDSGSYTCKARNEISGSTTEAVHVLSVKQLSSCSAGCVIGIIFACCVFAGLIGGICFYCKKRGKYSASEYTDDTTGGEGQNNVAFVRRSEDLTYADVNFVQSEDGEVVKQVSENGVSDYAEVKVTDKTPEEPSASSTPDANVDVKDAVPQSDADGAKTDAGDLIALDIIDEPVDLDDVTIS
ncbi:carcinoembryonic antigen-related cell adhesion molecule 5-like [Solea senegalensis]|uniref:Carcinoembryonic antigen-related cell adhesion molecule 5-like n=2 Tax=Solea senegalensis TaxID=28829 RepID=A0AAV6PX50_SOLSE|nr:carcinoembryonic antigen-related cell adhesion molecule 2-like isoform X1 [Solea senegalensis]KAG7475780.1 carcinoembryonic antigen-related cell adhesion molecule 5-like [Solea senegalensis]